MTFSKKTIWLFSCILIILIITGCDAAPTPDSEMAAGEPTLPSPTDPPSAPTATVPTSSPVPTMTATPTLTPPPTASPIPPTSTPAPPTATPPTYWNDVTEQTIGETSYWTNKVELADINGDGWVDLLFANGGNYSFPGTPVLSQVFLNMGPDEPFVDVSAEVFGGQELLARVIKVRDVNNDGFVDIFVGTTFQTQSRLFLGNSDGQYNDVTTTHLPQMESSIGDAEFGDIDADGDLDLVLGDWGPGSPLDNAGGVIMLWLNDGQGRFSNATSSNMPTKRVKFSWELEFVDADNDYDLDILISCKVCDGSFFYLNDGQGIFSNVSAERLPQYTNNYDFEAMDFNGDGYLDLITINDGVLWRERVFLNDQQGGFVDATDEIWPNHYNHGDCDDNMHVIFDIESDGDADFLIGSLSCQDRMLLNDEGEFRLLSSGKLPGRTAGTLGVAVADLNGDGRWDIVQAQGEVEGHEDERVYWGVDIPVDSAPPVITLVEDIGEVTAGEMVTIRARVHDNKSPTMPHDWQAVILRWLEDDNTEQETPMQWYGEYLWRVTLPIPSSPFDYQVCATDAVGNQTCMGP